FLDTKTLSLQHYHTLDLPVIMTGENDYIPGTAFFITKDAFVRTGGMNESYHTYWEDVDFSFRARRLGFRMARSFDANISHLVGKTCHKKSVYTTYYFQRNRIRFAISHLDPDYRKKLKEVMESDLKLLLEKSIAKNDKTKIGYIEEIFQELKML
ncbi:MAG TPA: hypothetical protein PK771_15130, partial [Spirochaetota bacterium]|nr:hypothetical protein [Spirochaetota bacterium]